MFQSPASMRNHSELPIRRSSFKASTHARYLSTPASYLDRSISQQAIARRSFEASNIEIMVTSPCAEIPSKGGNTTTVYPSPNHVIGLSEALNRFSFERLGKSLSLAIDNSGSSSGSEPLESPPTDLENGDVGDNGGVGIRGGRSTSSSGTRPSMRHFPQVSSIRNRAGCSSSDEDETYLSRSQSEVISADHKTIHSDIEPATMSKKLKVGVEELFNSRGRRRSKLLKKLKDQAGARLARLFSSDSEDTWDSSPNISASVSSTGSNTHRRTWSNDSSVDGPNENIARSSGTAYESHSLPGNRPRRPSMSIDLSTVPSYRNFILSQPTQPFERVPTPSSYRSRSGYSHFQTLPTIIGSPSIITSPVEQFYTPTAGSPVIMSAIEMPQQPIMGLFGLPNEHPQQSSSSDENLSGLGLGEDSTIIVDRASNGSGIDPLDSTRPVLPQSLDDTDPDMGMDLDLRVFSPSIYRAPHLMAMGNTPPVSPLELPALLDTCSSLTGLPPRSVGMRAMSSYGMLRQSTTSDSGSGSGSGSGSRSSTGSLRIKIDGHPPRSASISDIAAQLDSTTLNASDNVVDTTSGTDIGANNVSPLVMDIDISPSTKATLLPRSSVDFSTSICTGTNNNYKSVLAPRYSLPNVHFASPPTPTRVTFSPIVGSSPRLLGSPRFDQSSFPPISTPPSLLANPRSLGDPYPNGLSEKASHNLAGTECACRGEYHAHPHVKRRPSTKRESERKSSLTTPGMMDPVGEVLVAGSSTTGSELPPAYSTVVAEDDCKGNPPVAKASNPYFA